MFKFFIRTLPKHIVASFSGYKILFLIAAIASTYIIVRTGTDWKYLLAVRDPELNKMFFPAIIIGGFVPVSVPLFLVVVGSLFNRHRLTVMGWALGQAALIGSIVTSTLKALTGRIQPNLNDLIIDSSHQFQFGFMQHGIFWGWPSSHTAIAFAMAFTLIGLHVRNRHVIMYSLIYALYIGIGVSLSIHWLSEFVAGALIGTTIGMTVGAAFQKFMKAK
jgi:membrane-associated phospholipid phosphatase